MRLYFETTLFNYYFDRERDGHADTVRLFDSVRKGAHDAYTSEYAIFELQEAPEPKRSKMLALVKEYGISILPASDEANRMTDLYIAEGVIPAKFRDDSAHIAVASINKLDCVLSYNFQRINRLKTKILSERLNRKEGYNGIVICTAKEVLDDEQNRD